MNNSGSATVDSKIYAERMWHEIISTTWSGLHVCIEIDQSFSRRFYLSEEQQQLLYESIALLQEHGIDPFSPFHTYAENGVDAGRVMEIYSALTRLSH